MNLTHIKMENHTEQFAAFSANFENYENESPYKTSTSVRCKRILFGQKGQDKDQEKSQDSKTTQAPSVVRRNERERNRVRMVNSGFVTLRQHVPNGVKNKKMSKVETLKSAVDYIKQLQEMLMQGEASSVNEAPVDVKTEVGEDCYMENRMDYQNEIRRYPDFKEAPANYCASYNVPTTFNAGQSSFYSSNGSPALSWPSTDASSPGSQCHQDEEDMLALSSWFQ